MKILVTGATGFIGRHLCRSLVAHGYSVRGAHRATSATSVPEPAIEWVHLGDVGPDTDWSRALEGISVVVHMAGLAHQIGVPDKLLDQRFRSVNTEGTRCLAKSIAKVGFVKRLIFVSSVAASGSGYGRIPDTAYGRSKREAELALQQELKGSSAEWCIVRPPMVYGHGNPGNMERLMRLVDTGLPLPFGAIRNARSFVYVGNLVSAIECCMMHPSASGQTFTVTDGQAVSTPDLVRELARCKGQRARLFPIPVSLMKGMAQIGDIIKSLTKVSTGFDSYSIERLCGSVFVDNKEIAARLNWAPPFSMRDGLTTTLGRGEGENGC